MGLRQGRWFYNKDDCHRLTVPSQSFGCVNFIDSYGACRFESIPRMPTPLDLLTVHLEHYVGIQRIGTD